MTSNKKKLVVKKETVENLKKPFVKTAQSADPATIVTCCGVGNASR